MKRKLVVGTLAVAAGVAVWTWSASAAGRDVATRSVGERLLGPIASIAASLQWVRVDDAWNRGRSELADRRAEFALELAPGDPAGWLYYSRHLIYDRASRLREPLAVDRERWVRAGLAVLDRGERECRAPGAMAFQRGVVFLGLAQVDDEDRALPISRREAWTSAAESFERAARAGEPLAREAAELARQRADESAR